MVEELRNSIGKLIALYEGAERERLALKDQLDSKIEELEKSRTEIGDLKKQIDTLRLREAFTSETSNTTAAKEKIDSLVGEIDKCLDLLEK